MQTTKTARAALAVSMLLVCGCALSSGPSTVPDGFSQNARPGVRSDRKLAPGDAIELSVEVDGVVEIPPRRVEINYQGIATLPLVGDVTIGGKPLDQAREQITKIYGAYYVHPPVVVMSTVDGKMVGEWGYVTVMGRVNQPGRVPLRAANGINLSEAIQAAGGFAPSAKISDIRVTRIDKDGNKVRAPVNYEAIGQEGNAEADLKLIAGDIVYVPERIF